MRTSVSNGVLRGTALAAAVLLLLPTAALTQDDPGEKAITARQGFMQVVSWEAGPLFAMAKGDIAYDAEMAADNAENLNAIVQYNVGRLFIDGTSKSDRPGKTRALAALWEDMDGFAAGFEDLQEKIAAVAEEAGKGKDALTAAVSEAGKACGNCHDDFRAEKF